MEKNVQVTGNDDLVVAMISLRKRLENVQALTDQKRSDLRIVAEERLREVEAMAHAGHFLEQEWLRTDGVMVTLETVDHMNRVLGKFIQVMDSAVQTLMVDASSRIPEHMTN